MMLLWQARKARAEYERAMRILRQDLIRVNAEKADRAAERVGMIRTIEKLSRQDTEARKQFANSAGSLVAIHDGHLAVHENDIVGMLLMQMNCLSTIACNIGLATHLA